MLKTFLLLIRQTLHHCFWISATNSRREKPRRDWREEVSSRCQPKLFQGKGLITATRDSYILLSPSCAARATRYRMRKNSRLLISPVSTSRALRKGTIWKKNRLARDVPSVLLLPLTFLRSVSTFRMLAHFKEAKELTIL